MRGLHLIRRLIIIFFSLLFVVSCGSEQAGNENGVVETAAPNALATNDFDVGQSNRPILAVEVEISAEGIRALRASVIYREAQTDTALEKDLVVTFKAGEEIIVEYSIPDPRRVEIEGQQNEILATGQTFVYAPLDAELTTLEIKPLTGGSQPELPPVNQIDLVPILQQICEEQPDLEACQEIVNDE